MTTPALHRHRTTLLIGVAAVIAVTLALVLAGGPRTHAPLDPQNSGRDGSKALAQVLGDEGVDIHIARSADELASQDLDADTTLLVTSTELLGTSTLNRLRTDRGDAPLVLVMPPAEVSSAFGGDVGSTAYDESRKLVADCKDRELRHRFGDLTLDARGEGADWLAPGGCFYTGQGARLAQPGPGVLLLGVPSTLSNEHILRADNAAFALRLLGQHDDLVWYVPDAADLTASDARSFGEFLPDWVRPAIWLAVLAIIALILWRGRRLGRLVTEPLPVTVKAIETTHSRGRLYRKANDRAHAAAALRAAALASAAERLSLPTTTRSDLVVAQVAQRTGRDPAQVRHLLAPDATAPPTDSDLITLASDLATLEEEVRRT